MLILHSIIDQSSSSLQNWHPLHALRSISGHSALFRVKSYVNPVNWFFPAATSAFLSFATLTSGELTMGCCSSNALAIDAPLRQNTHNSSSTQQFVHVRSGSAPAALILGADCSPSLRTSLKSRPVGQPGVVICDGGVSVPPLRLHDHATVGLDTSDAAEVPVSAISTPGSAGSPSRPPSAEVRRSAGVHKRAQGNSSDQAAHHSAFALPLSKLVKRTSSYQRMRVQVQVTAPRGSGTGQRSASGSVTARPAVSGSNAAADDVEVTATASVSVSARPRLTRAALRVQPDAQAQTQAKAGGVADERAVPLSPSSASVCSAASGSGRHRRWNSRTGSRGHGRAGSGFGDGGSLSGAASDGGDADSVDFYVADLLTLTSPPIMLASAGSTGAGGNASLSRNRSGLGSHAARPLAAAQQAAAHAVSKHGTSAVDTGLTAAGPEPLALALAGEAFFALSISARGSEPAESARLGLGAPGLNLSAATPGVQRQATTGRTNSPRADPSDSDSSETRGARSGLQRHWKPEHHTGRRFQVGDGSAARLFSRGGSASAGGAFSVGRARSASAAAATVAHITLDGCWHHGHHDHHDDSHQGHSDRGVPVAGAATKGASVVSAAAASKLSSSSGGRRQRPMPPRLPAATSAATAASPSGHSTVTSSGTRSGTPRSFRMPTNVSGRAGQGSQLRHGRGMSDCSASSLPSLASLAAEGILLPPSRPQPSTAAAMIATGNASTVPLPPPPRSPRRMPVP